MNIISDVLPMTMLQQINIGTYVGKHTIEQIPGMK